MLLQTDNITISIDGLTIRTRKNNSAGQFMLDSVGIVGWLDGVPSRREAVARPVGNGDFKETGRLGSRSISITGIAEATSPQELHKMRDLFTSVLSGGEFRTISVRNAAGLRYASVGLAGTPSFVRQTDTFATWKLDLYSPDPEIYGPEKKAYLPGVRLSGGLAYPISYPLAYNAPPLAQASFAENLGNAPCWPVFKITGDYFAGFILTNGTGRQVVYGGSVTTSSPVTIDMARGSAMQNGVDKSFNLKDRDWFAIEPGSAIQPEFIPLDAGSGWCDIIYRDTWI